jgi:hypothetical protein
MHRFSSSHIAHLLGFTVDADQDTAAVNETTSYCDQEVLHKL